MEIFLDTCVIISAFNNKDRYFEVAEICLQDPEEKIISIYQDEIEMPNLFSRKERAFKEIFSYIQNKSYNVNFSGFTDKEKIEIKKLLQKINLRQENFESILIKKQELDFIRMNVIRFIQKKIQRKVIPLEDIRKDLVDMIKDVNGNKADAKVITSAIQEHQQKELIAFTLDKKDWKILPLKEKIEQLNLKCPEVRFLR